MPRPPPVHKLTFSAKVIYVPLWWPRYTIFRILSNCVAQGVPSIVGGDWKFVNILAIRTREENTSN